MSIPTPAPASTNAPITLSVKTIESQTHTVTVSLDDTVLQLKERLSEMLQVPSPRQRLIFRGRVMVDDKRLTEYSLQDGQTIHLVTRPADAPPTQPGNDTPRTSNSTAGSGPLRFDTVFGIIGMEDNMHPQNQLMQALAGSLPMGMEFGSPAVITIDGHPSALRSFFGGSGIPAGAIPGLDGARAPRMGGLRTIANASRSNPLGAALPRLRALANANRPVPLGASLPHLATIEAELTRAATQLRNVQAILAHPADQIEGMQLEPLDVPELESVDEDVDGDSTDLARMSSILTQLSETSRSMANHLQTLSDQYNEALLHSSERVNLQLVSLRAARAMYRLASVQNTVFPMLANATFVGTSPGDVTYRFQPAPTGFFGSSPIMSDITGSAMPLTDPVAVTMGGPLRSFEAPRLVIGSSLPPLQGHIFGPGSSERSGVNSGASFLSRRRERPEDFTSGAEDRSSSRRRLTTQHSPSTGDWESRLRQELDQLMGVGLPSPPSLSPAPPTLTSRPLSGASTSVATRISASAPHAPRAPVSRSSSSHTRRPPTTGNNVETSSTTSSPSPSSPSMPSSSGSGSHSNSSSSSPAYNLGRIGVFISAILRMVDQPREDGSPRTLADVICNDPESVTSPLQDLVRNVAESVTVRETRSIVEGHPAPLRNIHPVLNSFIRESALNGQQLTESNLDTVAIMFAHGIMNAVHVEDILETLSPPASIEISSADIRRLSLDVLREHFRRLIYLVVAAPTGRESNWPTFARDLVLWIRDVVGAWRVVFYGLFQERDQAEAQRIATHVVGSAIHANGRRWVELSNRATNTLVNVLCANIVPRRRGEEQAGGLVGGAWPLMATAPRQNVSRSRACMAPSLLGSTAPPAPLGPSVAQGGAFGSTSFSDASSSRSSAAGPAMHLGAEALSESLTRRLGQIMETHGWNSDELRSITASTVRDAVRSELSALRTSSSSQSSSSHSGSSSKTATAGESSTTEVSASDNASGASSSSSNSDSTSTDPSEAKAKHDRKTRVEEVSDEDMP